MRAMKMKRKTLAIVLSGTLALAAAGGAYAYWTTTGSGTGTAATGTSVPITTNQTTVVSDLRPGGAPQTLSGTFNNPLANGPQYVTSVSVTIASVTKAGGAPAGICDATDYVLTAATMTVGVEVPASAGPSGNWSGATIAFVNKGTPQDACKLATVNLAYAVL